jgi:hypothetical protein
MTEEKHVGEFQAFVFKAGSRCHPPGGSRKVLANSQAEKSKISVISWQSINAWAQRYIETQSFMTTR